MTDLAATLVRRALPTDRNGPERSLLAVWWPLLLAVLLLAWPLDLFREMGMARFALVPVCAVAGIFAAGTLHMPLIAAGWRANLALPALASLVVGGAVLVFDSVSLAQVNSLTLLYYPPRSIAEELIYRLGLTTVLCLAIHRLSGARVGIGTAFAIAAILAQAANVALGVTDAQDNLTYAALRYVAPGLVWAALYFRCGLLAAMIGHAGTHLWLDPLVLAIYS